LYNASTLYQLQPKSVKRFKKVYAKVNVSKVASTENQLAPWSRVLLEKLSHSLSQTPCLLWNLSVHYHVHKGPPLVSILS